MKHAIIALLALVLCAPAVIPAAGDDPAAPVRQFIDGFNSGDVQSAFAAYATGPITIVDEFAPHIWSGPNAAHEWADAYDKHAQATGVTDGKGHLRQADAHRGGRGRGVRRNADGVPLQRARQADQRRRANHGGAESRIGRVEDSWRGRGPALSHIRRGSELRVRVASSRGIAPASRKTAPQNISVSAM